MLAQSWQQVHELALPDEDAEHIGDAAKYQQHKHEQGQTLCGSSSEVLE